MLFLIAWRNLWRNRTRSLTIVLSVAIGLWAGAFMNSLYYGMGEGRLRIAIDHEASHLQLHHPRFSDDQEATYSLAADSLKNALSAYGLVKSFCLRTVAPAMLATAAGSQGIQINGIDPASEQNTRTLGNFVKTGEYLDTATARRILVSTRLADKLKLKTGGKIVLTTLDTGNNITSAAFRVCGLYQSENAPQDELNVFVLKNELDALLGTAGRAHEAAVLLHHDDDLDIAYAELQRQFPNALVQTWKDISPETALVATALDSYALIFMSIILLALAFGIVNTMLMAVLERTHELHMLMAIGMNKSRVFTMVLLETLLLSLAGAPIGLLAALGCVAWFGHVGIDFTRIAADVMRDFGYAAVIYPSLPLTSLLKTMLLVVITALLAAVFPAYKALKVI